MNWKTQTFGVLRTFARERSRNLLIELWVQLFCREAMVRNEPCRPNAGLCRKAALPLDGLGLRSTHMH